MSKYYFNKKEILRVQKSETNLLTFVSMIMDSKRYRDHDEKSSNIIKKISEIVLELSYVLKDININNEMYVPKEWEHISDGYIHTDLDKKKELS